MTYQEMLDNARKMFEGKCNACPVCNGKACGNRIPGPGAKGLGDTAMRNFEAWQKIRVNMDTICENGSVDTSLDLFGKKFKYPFFAGPVGAVALHYGSQYQDDTYNDILLKATADAGIAAFTGDGTNPRVVEAAAEALKAVNGMGVPTIKPWDKDTIRTKMDLVLPSNPIAVAMDIDAAGLPFLKNLEPPAGSKTVEELKEIIDAIDAPFILKGIMTVKGALKAKEAGASAIVVSNHGGRVLDQCPATAEVLPEIVKAVEGTMKIFVDGGIRTGTDVFKALALGADAVLIARPYVSAVYGGGEEGVKLLTEKLGAELADTCAMCGVHSLSEIDRNCVAGY